jgi:hypothetical protein
MNGENFLSSLGFFFCFLCGCQVEEISATWPEQSITAAD